MKENKDLALLTKLHADVVQMVAPFASVKVADFAQADEAITNLKALKDFTRRVDDTRKILVDPFNQRVKAINEYAKGLLVPLQDAERALKTELLAFERVQEQIRIEKQRAADAEATRVAEELAARQQAEQDALNAELDAQEEAAKIFGDDDADTGLKEQAQALEEKQVAEQAQAHNDRVTKEWEINQQRITNTRKTWKVELVDIDLVPKEFVIRTLNEKAVLAVVRAIEGTVVNIPGVRAWQETGLAVGRNTYVPRAALEDGR